MNAAYEPSIVSEVLRLCNRDTLPAPPPDDATDAPPTSSTKELVRTSEPLLDTIPAPPPSSAEREEQAPITIPGIPRLPTIVDTI